MKRTAFALSLLATTTAGQVTAASHTTIQLTALGSYASGVFDGAAAEIGAYDKRSKRFFVTNAAQNSIDVLNAADPSQPKLAFKIDLTPFGGGPNSVAVNEHGVVAVAVQAAVKTDPGKVVFFRRNGGYLNQLTVGALPDMLTYSPNGRWLLVANEGEPNDDYTIDPEGSVSIVGVGAGFPGQIAALTQADVRSVGFTGLSGADIDPNIRIFGPGASVAQDLEPEYIAVDPNSRVAYVSLQENNAMAVINIPKANLKRLFALGEKDHRIAPLDASNKDGAINIATWPVFGMYMPDAIATYRAFGHTFIVSANEGDSRDYGAFSEEARVKDLALDPVAFPDAASLQLDENLGRLKITTTLGDTDGDGDYDSLHAYGARSFSIWSEDGKLIYDSGAEFEQIIAAQLPADFNATNDENGTFDDRSDDKGAEPEALAIGRIAGRTYAFVGLERVGGIMVYDITDPFDVAFVQYINNRDFAGDAVAGTAGDLAPEGIVFIPRNASPTGHPMLGVTNEVSGTTTLYRIDLVK